MIPMIYCCAISALVFIALGEAIAKHGEDKPPFNGWLTFVAILIVSPVYYMAFRYALEHLSN